MVLSEWEHPYLYAADCGSLVSTDVQPRPCASYFKFTKNWADDSFSIYSMYTVINSKIRLCKNAKLTIRYFSINHFFLLSYCRKNIWSPLRQRHQLLFRPVIVAAAGQNLYSPFINRIRSQEFWSISAHWQMASFSLLPNTVVLRHIHMNHRPINFWSFQWKWNDKDDMEMIRGGHIHLLFIELLFA